MPILSQFQKVNSDDRVVNRIQDNIGNVVNPLVSNPLVSGQVIRDVSLVVGTNTINHKLGRVLQGWFMTRLKGAAVIYDAQDASQLPALTLTLISDAAVTCDIYVF